MVKKNVLICGATGYIGLQLTKLLCKHKHVNIKYLCGSSSVGKKISFYDKELKKYKLPKISKFNKKNLLDVDIIFTALPNGEAQLISKFLNKNNVLIDLAADFRLNTKNEYEKWYKIKHNASNLIKQSIYSIPEISGTLLKNFKIISCPGCYPTTILIPLIPLIKKNLINNKTIIIDSKSGYSGAGRGIHKKYKNKNLYESLSAYGLANHRHNSEIQQELDLKTGKMNKFHFTPHLTPMFRGILSSIYLDLPDGISAKKILSFLKNEYKNRVFIKFEKLNKPLSTNSVINSNNCLLSVCETKYKNRIVLFSAIDNLIKGGAGQAIQNMNIYFGFKENLDLK
jgi:N-acetyl-gamma-glutamyl-phosphate reductase